LSALQKHQHRSQHHGSNYLVFYQMALGIPDQLFIGVSYRRAINNSDATKHVYIILFLCYLPFLARLRRRIRVQY